MSLASIAAERGKAKIGVAPINFYSPGSAVPENPSLAETTDIRPFLIAARSRCLLLTELTCVL